MPGERCAELTRSIECSSGIQHPTSRNLTGGGVLHWSNAQSSVLMACVDGVLCRVPKGVRKTHGGISRMGI